MPTGKIFVLIWFLYTCMWTLFFLPGSHDEMGLENFVPWHLQIFTLLLFWNSSLVYIEPIDSVFSFFNFTSILSIKDLQSTLFFTYIFQFVHSRFSGFYSAFFFFQFSRDTMDLKHCVSLRYTAKWLDLIHYEAISEHPSSHIDQKLKQEKKIFLWWELLGFTRLLTFTAHSSVNYIYHVIHDILVFIYLITGTLYLLTAFTQ